MEVTAVTPGAESLAAMPPDTDEIRSQFPLLARRQDGRPLAYLDNGATSQKPLGVIDALDRYWREQNANVHRGVYRLSEEATELYERARQIVAARMGADRREVVFVRNATEALNLVAYSWGRQNVGEGDRILLTEMEHHSNVVPWQQLAGRVGAEIDWVPVTDEGLLDMAALAELLERGPKLLAVTHVSNVLGTENPLAEVSRLAHDAGALVLADGAQAAPKLPLDVAELGVDFYALTGHKLYAPTGIGALWAKLDLLREMPPFLGGGSMIKAVEGDFSTWAPIPAKFEAGTPAIAEAVGLGVAVDYLTDLGMDAVRTHERELTEYALERLATVTGLTTYGPEDPAERGGLVSFTIDGIHPHDLAELCNRDAVCIRAGHHCAQPLMRHLGVPATARASFSVYNGRDDVDRLVEALENAKRVFGV